VEPWRNTMHPAASLGKWKISREKKLHFSKKSVNRHSHCSEFLMVFFVWEIFHFGFFHEFSGAYPWSISDYIYGSTTLIIWPCLAHTFCLMSQYLKLDNVPRAIIRLLSFRSIYLSLEKCFCPQKNMSLP